MRNLVNFNVSSGKSENFHFRVLLLLIAYKVSAKKLQKNYLSWHWKEIQTLKKNWLFVWKMIWRIWWTLTWAAKSLKICILMGYFCRKNVVFELKNKEELCRDVSNLVSFHTSSWKLNPLYLMFLWRNVFFEQIYFWAEVAHQTSTFWTFQCLSPESVFV